MVQVPGRIGGFEVTRQLGVGGFGIVYEAIDRARGVEVALKTLARLDAAALYRFKREFRGLADVRHRNLVELYELVSEGREWLLVMELVRGGDCMEWIRHIPTRDAPTLPADAQRRPTPETVVGTTDFSRLRQVLLQLAEGLVALHATGKLHRDIKPSNVLVEHATGRVVIVDFGISTELDEQAGKLSDQNLLTGTPEYMAPEQGTGDALTEAADWYAVGVVLFEALTGRLPFVGAPLQILLDKQRYEAPRPSEIARDVPQDLAALCVDLLRVRPDSRPKGSEVLRRLGVGEPAPRAVSGTRAAPPTTRGERALLVGRDAELETLRDAFEATRAGKPKTVLVGGRSGMGKTALVRHFLDGVDGIVLSGRCYERESVPYKALDAVIDELSRALLRLPPSEAAAVVPRDAAALVRLFPVLQRVGVIAEAPRRAVGSADPQQLRMRGFGALRELLARVADRHPLVVFIDDLQWGDIDSAALLAELAAPPDPPSFLLVASYRREDEESSAPLRSLLAREAVRIDLEALSNEHIRTLASALLGESAPTHLVESIVGESRGSPLLVREVVDNVQSEAGAYSSTFRLEDMLRNRLAVLPGPARALLETLAIAGRPLRLDLAFRAAELQGDSRREALDYLRVARLVRAQGTRGSDTAEPSHDRVREAMLGDLDDARLREAHGSIARALREAGEADPEALFIHFNASGSHELATQYAEEAAAKSARALAFDRAAEFYRHALELNEDQARALNLREALGDALANAGRGADAAEAYIAAAEVAEGLHRLDLRRRAAEQLLVSGHIDQGMSATTKVLEQVGLKLAATPTRALLALIVLRLWVAVRGLGFREADPATVPPKTLARIDVAWSTAAGLSVVDNIRAAHFQTRNLLLCLRAGEPTRLLRALVLESVFVSIRGAKHYDRAQEIIAVCRDLAQRHPSSDNEALIDLAVASSAYFTGRWTIAHDRVESFLARYREGLTRLQWELRSLQYFGLCALIYRGQLRLLSQRLPAYLREARDRGDLYFSTNLLVGETNIYWLVEDQPDEARRVVRDAMERWSKGNMQVQHWYALQSLAQIDLYTGETEGTLQRVEEALPDVRKSLLLRVQHTHVKALWLHARCALARNDRASTIKAERDARQLDRAAAPWASALASLIRAGVRARNGQRDAAALRLREAIRQLDACEMPILEAAARDRLGRLTSDPKLVAEAAEAMIGEGIRDPERFAAMLVPGIV